MFKKSLAQGQAGENVGLLLRGVKREDVSRGQVICKPGSVKTYKVRADGLFSCACIGGVRGYDGDGEARSEGLMGMWGGQVLAGGAGTHGRCLLLD